MMRSAIQWMLGLVAAIASVGLLSACADEESSEHVATTVDSAGVQVTTIPARALDAVPVHTLIAETRIESNDTSDSADVLQGIRGPIVLSNGRIVLADAASASLRFFSPQLVQLSRVGRRGNGPGEFPGGIYALLQCNGDTLFVREQRRLSVFLPTGEYARTQTVEQGTPGAATTVIAITPDCRRMIVTASVAEIRRRDSRLVPAFAVHTINEAGERRNTGIQLDGPSGVEVSYMGRTLLTRAPWSPVGEVIVFDSTLIVGNSGAPELRIHDIDGRLMRVVRWTASSNMVTADDRRTFEEQRAELLRLYPEERPNLPNLDALPVPKTKPFFSRLFSGRDGTVWIREYSNADAGLPGVLPSSSIAPFTRWLVLSADGSPIRRVQLPSSFTPTWAKDTRIFGVQIGEDGEETVLSGQLISK